jgi:two-component system response regulator (stage 0 sporulation protein F)
MPEDNKTDPKESTGTTRTGMTILLAEDDANLRAMLAIVLRRENHRVVELRNGGELREQLDRLYGSTEAPPENLLVISDLRMPEADGLSLLRAVIERGHRPAFIILTAFGSPEVHAAARALGALKVLDKPFDFDDLRQEVRRFHDGARP